MSGQKKTPGNGSFKTTPLPFTQTFVLFGIKGDWKVPVVWGFLGEKKNEKLQSKFCMVLKEYRSEIFRIHFVREILITDFETEVIVAAREFFIGTNNMGCLSYSFNVFSDNSTNLILKKLFKRKKSQQNCQKLF